MDEGGFSNVLEKSGPTYKWIIESLRKTKKGFDQRLAVTAVSKV